MGHQRVTTTVKQNIENRKKSCKEKNEGEGQRLRKKQLEVRVKGREKHELSRSLTLSLHTFFDQYKITEKKIK